MDDPVLQPGIGALIPSHLDPNDVDWYHVGTEIAIHLYGDITDELPWPMTHEQLHYLWRGLSQKFEKCSEDEHERIAWDHE
jgi:hypothetical protein